MVWRVAPVIAAAALAVAVVRRWTLWSAWPPAIVLVLGAAALLGYILIATRAAGALGGPRRRRSIATRGLAASCAARAGSPARDAATSGRIITSSSPRRA